MASGDDEPNQFRDLKSQELEEEIFMSTSEEEENESFSDDDEKVPTILSINEDPAIKNLKIPKSSGEESSGGGGDHDDHLGIQQTETSANKFPWICEVCKKGFSSGQALGGHSRIHSQSKKQSLLIKRPHNPTTITSTISADSFNSNNAGGSSSIYNNNTCCVCAKSFPSEKSLFGHMRCHPDRDWRGIQPPNLPPANKNSSSSTLFEAEAMPIHKIDDHHHIDSATNGPSSVVVDLSQSLSGWLSTARRGKKSTLSNPGAGSGSGSGSGSPSGLDEQIPEDVAYNLMMLAHGHKDSLNSGLPFYKQRQEQHQGVDHVPQVITIPTSSSLANMRMPKIEPQRDQVSESTKMKRRMEASDDVVGYGINYYSGKKLKIEKGVSSRNVNNGNEIPIPLKSTERGKTRQADSDDMDDSDRSGDKHIESYRMINLRNEKRRSTDRYKCTTCNKSFPTHQALGGHRSSHTKLKNNIPALVKDESAVYAAPGLLADVEGERLYANAQVGETEEYDEVAASSRLQIGGDPHQSKVCNKTFGTCQALEGNKRGHWTAGPIEGQSSQAASSGEASHTGGRRIPINLNEIPAMEDEEGAESALAQVPQHSAG